LIIGKWGRRMLAAWLLCCALPCGAAQAADYPTRPIRILAPFTPGSLSDVRLRKIAEHIGPRLRQPVVIENRTGGGGMIAAHLAARAAPDGYTVLFVNDSIFAISPHVQADAGLDPLTAFAPVIQLANTYFLVTVPAAFPARTLQELVAEARKRSGGLTYGTSGTGTVQHFGTEQFARLAGIQLTQVPYKGETETVTALLGGFIDTCLCTYFGVAPHIKAGKLRALAVTSRQRLAILPDVPTVAESGFPGFSYVVTGGIVAPAGTPPSIVALLNREMAAAMASSDLRAFTEAGGSELVNSTPEQFGAYMRREHERYGRMVRELGLGGAK
jgi:tripartite-type tricarboxylate transporter receptor subunit TctC